MSRVWSYCLAGMLAIALLATAVYAGTPNAADYPLRVHLFQFNGVSHYYRPGGGIPSSLDSVDGEGRANLFENGDPKGFDFSYSCAHRLMTSAGYETYLARWKKPGRVLEILLPVLGGKPGEMNSCELKVTLKPDSAYTRHNGLLGEEPAAQFKAWMIKYQYDPEHGKNQPVKPAQTSDATNPAALPSAAPGNQ